MDWKRTNMKSYGRTLKFLTWPMRVLFFTMLVVISMATVADAQRFNNGLTNGNFRQNRQYQQNFQNPQMTQQARLPVSFNDQQRILQELERKIQEQRRLAEEIARRKEELLRLQNLRRNFVSQRRSTQAFPNTNDAATKMNDMTINSNQQNLAGNSVNTNTGQTNPSEFELNVQKGNIENKFQLGSNNGNHLGSVNSNLNLNSNPTAQKNGLRWEHRSLRNNQNPTQVKGPVNAAGNAAFPVSLNANTAINNKLGYTIHNHRLEVPFKNIKTDRTTLNSQTNPFQSGLQADQTAFSTNRDEQNWKHSHRNQNQNILSSGLKEMTENHQSDKTIPQNKWNRNIQDMSTKLLSNAIKESSSSNIFGNNEYYINQSNMLSVQQSSKSPSRNSFLPFKGRALINEEISVLQSSQPKVQIKEHVSAEEKSSFAISDPFKLDAKRNSPTVRLETKEYVNATDANNQSKPWFVPYKPDTAIVIKYKNGKVHLGTKQFVNVQQDTFEGPTESNVQDINVNSVKVVDNLNQFPYLNSKHSNRPSVETQVSVRNKPGEMGNLHSSDKDTRKQPSVLNEPQIQMPNTKLGDGNDSIKTRVIQVESYPHEFGSTGHDQTNEHKSYHRPIIEVNVSGKVPELQLQDSKTDSVVVHGRSEFLHSTGSQTNSVPSVMPNQPTSESFSASQTSDVGSIFVRPKSSTYQNDILQLQNSQTVVTAREANSNVKPQSSQIVNDLSSETEIAYPGVIKTDVLVTNQQPNAEVNQKTSHHKLAPMFLQHYINQMLDQHVEVQPTIDEKAAVYKSTSSFHQNGQQATVQQTDFEPKLVHHNSHMVNQHSSAHKTNGSPHSVQTPESFNQRVRQPTVHHSRVANQVPSSRNQMLHHHTTAQQTNAELQPYLVHIPPSEINQQKSVKPQVVQSPFNQRAQHINVASAVVQVRESLSNRPLQQDISQLQTNTAPVVIQTPKLALTHSVQKDPARQRNAAAPLVQIRKSPFNQPFHRATAQHIQSPTSKSYRQFQQGNANAAAMPKSSFFKPIHQPTAQQTNKASNNVNHRGQLINFHTQVQPIVGDQQIARTPTSAIRQSFQQATSQRSNLASQGGHHRSQMPDQRATEQQTEVVRQIAHTPMSSFNLPVQQTADQHIAHAIHMPASSFNHQLLQKQTARQTNVASSFIDTPTLTGNLQGTPATGLDSVAPQIVHTSRFSPNQEVQQATLQQSIAPQIHNVDVTHTQRHVEKAQAKHFPGPVQKPISADSSQVISTAQQDSLVKADSETSASLNIQQILQALRSVLHGTDVQAPTETTVPKSNQQVAQTPRVPSKGTILQTHVQSSVVQDHQPPLSHVQGAASGILISSANQQVLHNPQTISQSTNLQAPIVQTVGASPALSQNVLGTSNAVSQNTQALPLVISNMNVPALAQTSNIAPASPALSPLQNQYSPTWGMGNFPMANLWNMGAFGNNQAAGQASLWHELMFGDSIDPPDPPDPSPANAAAETEAPPSTTTTTPTTTTTTTPKPTTTATQKPVLKTSSMNSDPNIINTIALKLAALLGKSSGLPFKSNNEKVTDSIETKKMSDNVQSQPILAQSEISSSKPVETLPITATAEKKTFKVNSNYAKPVNTETVVSDKAQNLELPVTFLSGKVPSERKTAQPLIDTAHLQVINANVDPVLAGVNVDKVKAEQIGVVSPKANNENVNLNILNNLEAFRTPQSQQPLVSVKVDKLNDINSILTGAEFDKPLSHAQSTSFKSDSAQSKPGKITNDKSTTINDSFKKPIVLTNVPEITTQTPLTIADQSVAPNSLSDVSPANDTTSIIKSAVVDLLSQIKQLWTNPDPVPTTTTEKPCTPDSPNYSCVGTGMFAQVNTIGTWCLEKCRTTGCVEGVCKCSCTNPQLEVAGWQGTTTQSALGSLDRANTTDVPEEIEPIPGKSWRSSGRTWRQQTGGGQCHPLARIPDIVCGKGSNRQKCPQGSICIINPHEINFCCWQDRELPGPQKMPNGRRKNQRKKGQRKRKWRRRPRVRRQTTTVIVSTEEPPEEEENEQEDMVSTTQALTTTPQFTTETPWTTTLAYYDVGAPISTTPLLSDVKLSAYDVTKPNDFKYDPSADYKLTTRDSWRDSQKYKDEFTANEVHWGSDLKGRIKDEPKKPAVGAPSGYDILGINPDTIGFVPDIERSRWGGKKDAVTSSKRSSNWNEPGWNSQDHGRAADRWRDPPPRDWRDPDPWDRWNSRGGNRDVRPYDRWSQPPTERPWGRSSRWHDPPPLREHGPPRDWHRNDHWASGDLSGRGSYNLRDRWRETTTKANEEEAEGAEANDK